MGKEEISQDGFPEDAIITLGPLHPVIVNGILRLANFRGHVLDNVLSLEVSTARGQPTVATVKLLLEISK